MFEKIAGSFALLACALSLGGCAETTEEVGADEAAQTQVLPEDLAYVTEGATTLQSQWLVPSATPLKFDGPRRRMLGSGAVRTGPGRSADFYCIGIMKGDGVVAVPETVARPHRIFEIDLLGAQDNVYWTNPNVRLRESPEFGNVITKTDGGQARVLEVQGAWAKVELLGSSRTGWINIWEGLEQNERRFRSVRLTFATLEGAPANFSVECRFQNRFEPAPILAGHIKDMLKPFASIQATKPE